MNFMKHTLPVALAFCLMAGTLSAQKKAIKFIVDLTRVVNDRVLVTLQVPALNVNETVFHLPKIIPGTYSIADYGRYIADVKAFDKKGNELTLLKIDSNSWKISNAGKLAKVTYWVDDIMDDKRKGPDIYPMAATNIEEGKNFVINPSGFFGYFENTKEIPVNLDVIRPKELYGSTGMIALETGLPLPKVKKEIEKPNPEARIDRYQLENYDRLIDSPLMYAKPDTAVVRVAGTEVLIGCYSPTGKVSAREIASTVREVLNAQAKYLGGKLPVEKYAFLFFFTEKPVVSYGALEHWYSSFYYMPEQPIAQMQQQLRDFAAHEFFHIVTPLNIHSKEIHHFGFNDPKMSKHLWLYEGVTEYFAGNVQVKYGLISQTRYLSVLRQKMQIASSFLDDVAFTDISKFTLDRYADQYYNVYQKGALIGMCLDIKLRKLSDGNYGMQNLLADLAKKYGKNQPFQDEDLFSDIEKLTYPEVGEFLKRYVGGPEKLPLAEVFDLVGVAYQPEKVISEFSLGFKSDAVSVADVKGVKKLIIVNTEKLNDQGKKLNFRNEDILEKINGEKIPEPGPELGVFLEKHKAQLAEGNTLNYTVLRKDESGAEHEVELRAPVAKVEVVQKHVLTMIDQPTPEQLALRNAWLMPR